MVRSRISESNSLNLLEDLERNVENITNIYGLQGFIKTGEYLPSKFASSIKLDY